MHCLFLYYYCYSNSGIRGGQFLERTRISKPNCTPEEPDYYIPKDFHIGEKIEAFKHQFVITGADEYVIKYMRERPAEFPSEVIASFEGLGSQKEEQD